MEVAGEKSDATIDNGGAALAVTVVAAVRRRKGTLSILVQSFEWSTEFLSYLSLPLCFACGGLSILNGKIATLVPTLL